MKPGSPEPTHRRAGFFALLSGKPLRERAASLAQSFSDRCPLPGAKRKAPSTRDVEKALAILYREAAAFSRECRLGILGRARFAKAIQDQLIDKGYPAELVMKITSAVSAKALVRNQSPAQIKTGPPGSS